MDLMLEGRRCLVTGVSAGIGAAIAEGLAREGAIVVATARREDKLEQWADAMQAQGLRRPLIVAGDITDARQVGRIACQAAQLAGPIEVLVNCAGGSRPVTLEAGEDAWDEAMALNFTAGRRLAEQVLPGMREAGWGRIINITGLMEPHFLNAALAAKAALHLWAKGLSRDLAKEGITINSIAPGRIESEQVRRLYPESERAAFIERYIPVGYFGVPGDLACLAVFLASPLARYITGTLIPVDGGMSHKGA
ncbi:SDR family NAD(P)-dependent oxidoreductase [Advenella mimigardefordensis]|uniref:Putative oxidoreductase, SDR family n=1 Tax=Advenella mimigardefordensis (strain DSM 17166 / LMG 22922 / DPN7) TaxID=1247726 RepID=W0P9E7_ADVMD|nr:SDR family oxidoreductase [Advenella mimigardefordensis]AHG63479.1 putative oxidoreductase, SDR family [Advenella mimigardefordensis DPN7]